MPSTLHERYETLYSTFGNAWRVTSKNTLFDYAPGASTATFTNTKWPVENAKTCTIPNQTVVKPVSATVAEAACKSVTNTKLHASCVFDVQITGDTHYAATYEASESAHKILSIKPIDLKLVLPAASKLAPK
jgi:lysyl endopeptidase